MPRSACYLALAVAVAFVAVGGAQTMDTLLASPQVILSPHIYEFREDGSAIRNVITVPGRWAPTWITPDGDNRGFLCAGTALDARGVIFSFDRQAVVTFGTMTASSLHPRALWRSSDGDWFVVDLYRTLRLSGGTLSTLSTHSVAMYSNGRDDETGELIFRGIAGARHAYYKVDPRTGATTTFWTRSGYQIWEGGSPEILYDVATGGIVELAHNPVLLRTQLVLRQPGVADQVIWENNVSPLFVPLTMTRASQDVAAAYHIVGFENTSPLVTRIMQLDANGAVLARNVLAPAIVSGVSEITVAGSRPLAWHVDRAPNGRRLRISVPSKPGKPYIAVFSQAGVRPGFPMGTATLPLVFDALTILSIQGGIPGVIENNVGTLDASGVANVKVDTNGFGASLKGLRAWAAVVIQDPAAPNGVSHVLGPLVLNITR